MPTKSVFAVVVNFTLLVPSPATGLVAMTAVRPAVLSGAWIHPAPGIALTVMSAAATRLGTARARMPSTTPALAARRRRSERRVAIAFPLPCGGGPFCAAVSRQLGADRTNHE